jgi:hypothetical protein
MDEPTLQQIATFAIAVIAAIVAYWQNRKKEAIVKIMTDPKALPYEDTISLLNGLPARSYLMSDDTRQWILSSESKEDQDLIEKQVRNAEACKLLSYQVVYSQGGYQIEYGLIKSSWRKK